MNKLDLSPLDDLVLDSSTKGLPTSVDRIRLLDVGAAGWRLHRELQLPAAVLRRSALEANGGWMRTFAEHAGVVLCPHGKTTMAPQLFQRQLDDGAWGLTCATFAHLRTYRRFGVDRILFANQLPSPRSAEWLARQLAHEPKFEIYVFVDSAEGADLLAAAAKTTGLQRPIPILLEVGYPDSRTGVRTMEQATALARHIARSSPLALAGIATFEGVVPGGGVDVEMEPHVEALFTLVTQAAESLAHENLFRAEGPVVLSAGGSRFFDLAARRLKAANLGRDTLVVLRSGCYVTHDSLTYERAFKRLLERDADARTEGGRLRPAIEVWAEVQSHPEPGRFYVNLGRRDVSYDSDLPKPIAWMRPGDSGAAKPLSDVAVSGLSDQHAHLTAPADCPLRFGDQVGFGISHPCTTFDKWRVLYEIDDDDRVVGAIATFF